MKRQPAQDVQLITHGSVTLKVYTINRGHRNVYSVADREHGRRKLRQFSELETALKWASERAKSLDHGKPAMVNLSANEGALYHRILDVLRPTEKDLDQAIAEYVQAHGILDGLCTLPEAANFYQKRHGSVTRKTVPEIFEEFLEDRKDSRPAYLHDLHLRLRRFSRHFTGFIGNLTHVEIGAWLRSLGGSNRSRFNYLRTIKTLFKFAQERGYLAQGETEPERIKIRLADESEVSIFTVSEMRRLLAAAREPELPYLIFGAFAGVRTGEIARLRWEDIDPKAEHLEIKASRAKTRSRRLVPINATLRKWLFKIADDAGPACSLESPDSIVGALASRCSPPIEWRRNALRHSYASYRLAQLDGDENRLALELGNSPTMIFKHYRALVTKTQANEWFALNPKSLQ